VEKLTSAEFSNKPAADLPAAACEREKLITKVGLSASLVCEQEILQEETEMELVLIEENEPIAPVLGFGQLTKDEVFICTDL
jgi:hypothetical protein